MGKVAHCSGCGRYVELSSEGECPQGHQRAMLRDVREGALPRSVARQPEHATSASPNAAVPNEIVAWIVGKSIIIVPLAAVAGFGLWMGYEEAIRSGLSPLVSAVSSIGSLAMTVGLAFVWAIMRKRTR